MPTAKPRITITLSEQDYAVLVRLSALQGSPMARIVSDLVADVSPLLRTLCDTIEAAVKADEKARAHIRRTMQEAENDLLPIAQAVRNQLDLFSESIIHALQDPPSSKLNNLDSFGASAPTGDPQPVITGVNSTLSTPTLGRFLGETDAL